MTAYRIRPTQLCMADAMPFQQHHEARISGRDIADVITPELFLDVASNLQVGDEIVLCGYQDQNWQRLTQFVRLRVVAKEPKEIRVMMDGEVRDIPLNEQAILNVPTEPSIEVAKAPPTQGGGYNVIDRKAERILEGFRTKQEAMDWAAAHDPAFRAAMESASA